MYQKFTPDDTDEYCHVMEKGNRMRHLNPQKETLALIMQFACAYHVEKKLPARLSEIILN
jgi:hypothetical protein